ncbi:hypothetical protein C8J57DRAFT_106076, partial [Mycena rebaudengoi]
CTPSYSILSVSYFYYILPSRFLLHHFIFVFAFSSTSFSTSSACRLLSSPSASTHVSPVRTTLSASARPTHDCRALCSTPSHPPLCRIPVVDPLHLLFLLRPPFHLHLSTPAAGRACSSIPRSLPSPPFSRCRTPFPPSRLPRPSPLAPSPIHPLFHFHFFRFSFPLSIFLPYTLLTPTSQQPTPRPRSASTASRATAARRTRCLPWASGSGWAS